MYVCVNFYVSQHAVFLLLHVLFILAHTHTHTHTQVKHLLILREQLVPFDIEFAAIEKRLDFKSTRGALTKFFGESRNVFRMGTDNALYSLAVDSVPTVNEEEVCVYIYTHTPHPHTYIHKYTHTHTHTHTQVDSKKELEESLKLACNAFISHASTHLASPLLSLLQKAQAFLPLPPPPPTNTHTHTHTHTRASSPLPDEASIQRLMEQPFMQQDRVEVGVCVCECVCVCDLKEGKVLRAYFILIFF
jgi:hypothetical protein